MIGLFALACAGVVRAELPSKLTQDPHVNALGFFDVHLCNWPDRPAFLKVLFSSVHPQRIATMRVYDPKGRLLVRLDKARFRLLRRKGKPDKKVFMQDVDVEGRIPDGWYRIEVEDNNGNIHRGWDYVLGVRLQRAEGMRPSGDEALRSPPVLQWSDVPGAAFYQVFVYDAWTESVKYTSPLITEPRLDLSKAGLEPEYYYWRVHARDVNGHVLLGDFQSGSMSGRAYFSLLPE